MDDFFELEGREEKTRKMITEIVKKYLAYTLLLIDNWLSHVKVELQNVQLKLIMKGATVSL